MAWMSRGDSAAKAAIAGGMRAVSREKEFCATGVATGGMIPKLETCITAVDHGVEAAVILDGRTPHVLLMELFTDYGAGTLIKAD